MSKSLYVEKGIRKFLNRLHVKNHYSFQITNLKINNNMPSVNFMKRTLKYPVLQLFRSSHSSCEKHINKIFTYGFKENYGNQGYGVYLTSHARHSVCLGRKNVFVCEVSADDKHIERYLSEIYSPDNNNEYLVKYCLRKPNDIIYPRFWFTYEVSENIYKEIGNKIWTNDMIKFNNHDERDIILKPKIVDTIKHYFFIKK